LAKIKNRIHYFVKTPKEALTYLRKKIFKSVSCCGGKLNASFMKEKLVDEIYSDLEPVILGKGIGIFRDKVLNQI